MSIGERLLALCLALPAITACASAVISPDATPPDDAVVRPIMPDWGTPLVEYEQQSLGHSGRDSFARVSIFAEGSICFVRRIPRISLLDATFELNQVEPSRWSAFNNDDFLRFEAMVAMKGAEGDAADAQKVGEHPGEVSNPPCVVIDVFSDPREGSSHRAAILLAQQRAQVLEERLRQKMQMKRIVIRNHGWRDTAILDTQEPSRARARVQIDPTCTAPKSKDNNHLDVRRKDMIALVAALEKPITTLPSSSFSFPEFSPHANHIGFRWRPWDEESHPLADADRSRYAELQKQLMDIGPDQPTVGHHYRLWADSGVAPEDSGVTDDAPTSIPTQARNLERFFESMIENRCEPQTMDSTGGVPSANNASAQSSSAP